MEKDDFSLNGPFIIDADKDTVSIGEVDIYPGTFKKVDLYFMINNSTIFDGNSIFIAGNYTPANGTVLSVILRSNFDQQVQVPLINGRISVLSNSRISLSVIMDAQSWIRNLDLSTASIINDGILIDKDNNPDLLVQFKQILASKMEVNCSFP